MRYRKGFTLIEIAMVVAFIGILFLLGSNILDFSAKGFQIGNREFIMQSSLRAVAETNLKKIRYSSAVFTIPKSSFREGNLTDKWDYFGIEDVILNGKPASQIVQYTWNPSKGINGGHDRRIVAEAKEGVTYEFVFSKDTTISNVNGENVVNETNFINFKIVGFLNGDRSKPYIKIDGGTMAANSLQAVNYGTELDPAGAIAFRSDSRDEAHVANVAILLDTSLSMDMPMDGLKRIMVLKTAAEKLIKDFGAYTNIDIALIPFSTYARPQPFINANVGNADLINFIYNDSSFEPDGRTNTGDAIRMAYYLLRDHAADSRAAGTFPQSYLILLADGDTTMCSIKKRVCESTWTMDEDIGWYWEPSGNERSAPLSESDYLLDTNSSAKSDFYAQIDINDWMTMDYSYYQSGEISAAELGLDSNGFLPGMYLQPKIFNLVGLGSAADGSADSMDYCLAGDGVIRLPFTSDYVKKCGELFNQHGLSVTPFVIGLSEDISSYGITEIKDALNAEKSNVFTANDLDSLSSAFTQIYDSIANELWFLNGPKL